MKSLTELFGVPKLEFMKHDGEAAIRKFARQYPNEVRLADNGSEHWGTETEVFTLQCDLSEELEVVFCGRIVFQCPERIAYDSGWQGTIEDVLERMIEGATTIYVDDPKALREQAIADGDGDDPDDDGPSKALAVLPSRSKKRFNKFIRLLRDAAKHGSDMSYVATLGVYYGEKQASIKKHLEPSLIPFFDKALRKEKDESYICTAVQRACLFYRIPMT